MIERLQKAVIRWREIRKLVDNCSEAYQPSLRHIVVDAFSPSYLCPFEHCTDNKKLYGSRQMWAEHLQAHLKFIQPFKKAQRKLGLYAPLICPLCRVDFGMISSKRNAAYIYHVATHLEDIALLACAEHHTQVDEIKHHSSTSSSGEDDDSITGWSSNSEAESGNDE